MANLKSEYRRVRKNLLSKINRYKRMGADVSGILIPSIPKKITFASIRRLKKIEVTKKIKFPDLSTGELISYQKFRNLGFKLKELNNFYNPPKNTPSETLRENESVFRESFEESENVSRETFNTKLDSYIPKFSDIVLDNFRELIDKYPNFVQAYFIRWLEGAIKNVGAEETASSLEKAKNDGILLDPEEAYSLDIIYTNINSLTRYLDLNVHESRDFKKSLFNDTEYLEWEEIL